MTRGQRGHRAGSPFARLHSPPPPPRAVRSGFPEAARLSSRESTSPSAAHLRTLPWQPRSASQGPAGRAGLQASVPPGAHPPGAHPCAPGGDRRPQKTQWNPSAFQSILHPPPCPPPWKLNAFDLPGRATQTVLPTVLPTARPWALSRLRPRPSRPSWRAWGRRRSGGLPGGAGWVPAHWVPDERFRTPRAQQGPRCHLPPRVQGSQLVGREGGLELDSPGSQGPRAQPRGPTPKEEREGWAEGECH